MRLKLLAALARLLRIQFKVDGLPFGARQPTDAWIESSRSKAC